MKIFLYFFILICNIQCAWHKNEILSINSNNVNEMKNIYQFKVTDINENFFDFSTLKGKKLMIVNTASECGYTSQYKQLQEVYEHYKDKNFIIIGFPANDFGQQEPGTNKDIIAFCEKNYGVKFPMMSKISVSGKNMHPIYQFLTQKTKNGLIDSEVKWNFQKYLIDEKGNLVKLYYSKTLPNDEEILTWIEN